MHTALAHTRAQSPLYICLFISIRILLYFAASGANSGGLRMHQRPATNARSVRVVGRDGDSGAKLWRRRRSRHMHKHTGTHFNGCAAAPALQTASKPRSRRTEPSVISIIKCAHPLREVRSDAGFSMFFVGLDGAGSGRVANVCEN